MGQPIIILNSAIDQLEGRDALRGVIARESLSELLIDDYQREKLPASTRSNIKEALEAGERLPDVELGMRGQNCKLEEREGMNVITLLDPVYLIDGLQRRETILEYLARNCEADVHLGALIHFGTTRDWERDRFYKLNKHRVPVSPNILLRNRREENAALTMLWGLTHTERTFVLCDRVQWGQQMNRNELISITTLTRVTGLLHSHRLPGRSSNAIAVATALKTHLEQFGVQAMRENLRRFYGLIDECWNIRTVHFKKAAHLKAGFMTVLARIISDHYDFWDEKDDRRLVISAPMKRRIAKFPIEDPTVGNLAGANGLARDHLYQLFVSHINGSRRTNVLRPRHASMIGEGAGDAENDSDSEVEAEANAN